MHLPSWRIRVSVSPEGFFFCKTQRYRKEISIITSVLQMMQWNGLTKVSQQVTGKILEQDPHVLVQGWTGENFVEELQLDVSLCFPAHCWQVVFPLQQKLKIEMNLSLTYDGSTFSIIAQFGIIIFSSGDSFTSVILNKSYFKLWICVKMLCLSVLVIWNQTICHR